MSRHRDIRNLDYDEEYDEAYDDAVYGHSWDENELGVSPSTAEQYLYSKRGDNLGLGAYFPDAGNIKEEEECKSEDEASSERSRRDSTNYIRPTLSSEDEIRLFFVMDELRNIVGENFSDSCLTQTVLEYNYDMEASLNALLNHNGAAVAASGSKGLAPVSVSASGSKGLAPVSVSVTRSSGALSTVSSSSTRPELSASSSRRPLPCNEDTTDADEVFSSSTSASKYNTAQHNGYGGECDKYGGENANTAADEIDDNLRAMRLNAVEEQREKDGNNTSRLNVKLRDKEVNVEEKYHEERDHGREMLNLVVVGHVDAGKSTLMGHLLYLQGIVSQRAMHKYEQESRKLGKQSFMYAWVLDDTEEERSRGVTVDIAQRTFETDTKSITLLDAPGHRDFIPNMITGAARADVAVLVVDASTGGFEAGFDSGGQTREHAVLIRSLGVCQLCVAVNKLDIVEWREGRFREVCDQLRQFLKTVGFKDTEVTYVPCSGLTGENLVSPPKDKLLKWYNGPTLLQAIDRLQVPDRGISRACRLCISDVHKGQGSNVCIGGRLQTGYIQAGDRLMLMPHAEVVTVKGVSSDSNEGGSCFAGDHVSLSVAGVDAQVFHVGDFLCDPQQPIPQVSRIQARIVVFSIKVPIIKGSRFDFHYQSVVETCCIRKLVSQLHRSTGQVVKQRPRALIKNTSAVVDIDFPRPLCLEVYRDFKELGRFMLRNSGTTVAAGMVTMLMN